ncbi:ENR1 protein, partial [Drymodes brunneopygia]|nr:ENR1 protein [Drymodes brunneopygia]
KMGIEDILRSGKNLFLDLVERISHEFNISNCWICGNTGMSEVWPWEGTALSPLEIIKLLKINQRGHNTLHKRDPDEVWKLKSRTIGEECLWRRG